MGDYIIYTQLQVYYADLTGTNAVSHNSSEKKNPMFIFYLTHFTCCIILVLAGVPTGIFLWSLDRDVLNSSQKLS